MTKKPPANGPTFSKATIKNPKRPPPSPARVRAEQEQVARDTAKSRRILKLLHTDTTAFFEELGLGPGTK